MSILNRVGLMTQSDVANFTRNLMIGNDLDFDAAVANVLKKAEGLMKLSDDATTKALRIQAEANAAQETAANAAADAFKAATGSKVDTTTLRAAAAALLAATNWFEKWDVTGLSKKYLKAVLAFAGITDDVLSKMRVAAADKKAEADRLEAEAAQALVDATEANENAIAKIAEEFQANIAKASPLLAKAVEYNTLAASLMETYKVLSAA